MSKVTDILVSYRKVADIDVGYIRGPVSVTILPTDKGFVTGGCQEWVGPGQDR
jgi:hypothetical protein